MLVRLSHIVDNSMPVWPGAFSCEVEHDKSLERGDRANAYIIRMLNHFSTHIDTPSHYRLDGKNISQLPLEDFFYDNPLLVDIPKGREELVFANDLRPFESKLKDADLLMIRTGFTRFRIEDPEMYAGHGPAVSADAAKYLMEGFRLKAIAVDWISLANPIGTRAPMDDGHIAHDWLLGKHTSHHTCIIEDACFEGIVGKKLKRVYGIPLIIGMEVDSAPITMIAELDG